MDLLELLDAFEETNTKEVNEGMLVEIIDRLVESRAFFILDLICFFLERYYQIGNLRAYSKREIQEAFPWEQSQIQLLLKKAIQQQIVHCNKRKYSINTESILVKRLWNYFFFSNISENELKTLEETFELSTENKKLREEIFSMKKNHNLSHSNIASNMGEIVDEISNALTDSFDPKEILFIFWKDKKSFIVNYNEDLVSLLK